VPATIALFDQNPTEAEALSASGLLDAEVETLLVGMDMVEIVAGLEMVNVVAGTVSVSEGKGTSVT